MENRSRSAHILLVEDSEADIRLIIEAFKESRTVNKFYIARDGEAAIDYLEKIGADDEHKRPDMIFLDLNLPKKDGLVVLEEIKSNPLLRSIPVVVLTTSNAEEHVFKSYHLNANCYITKPVEFDRFVEVVKLIDSFWFGIAMLPSVN
jgi:chemotaxis family two-component system response regulator Rcp1